jgi:hypothetical protein
MESLRKNGLTNDSGEIIRPETIIETVDQQAQMKEDAKRQRGISEKRFWVGLSIPSLLALAVLVWNVFTHFAAQPSGSRLQGIERRLEQLEQSHEAEDVRESAAASQPSPTPSK